MKKTRFLKDEKGAVLPLVALFIFLVALGVTALVIDVGMMYSERRSMVAAADAGALAGAQELNKETTLEDIMKLAREVSIKNGADSGNLATATVTLNGDKGKLDDGEIIVIADRSSSNEYNKPYVEVLTNKNTQHYFAQIFGVSDTDVKAEAVATYDLIAFQEFVFPLGAIYDDFHDAEDNRKINTPVYFHERKPLLGNNSWSGLLDLDPSSGSGAKEIQEIIEDRLEFPVDEFLKSENDIDYFIDVANGWKTFSDAVKTLIDVSHTLPVAQRQEYLTGYIPVLKDVVSVPNSSKNVPILTLAEFVAVDYADNQKKWMTENYKYTIADETITVEYDKIESGKNLTPYTEQDTILGYFTGKTITILEAYSSEVKVYLFK